MIWTMLILAIVLIPVTAWAMNNQGPQGYPFLTYCWVCLTAMGGSLVSILTKIREGHTRIFNLTEIVGELFIAGFSGTVTFWCCELLELPQLATVVGIAVVGHMGSRGMAWVEQLLTLWLSKRFGITQPAQETTRQTNEKE